MNLLRERDAGLTYSLGDAKIGRRLSYAKA